MKAGVDMIKIVSYTGADCAVYLAKEYLRKAKEKLDSTSPNYGVIDRYMSNAEFSIKDAESLGADVSGLRGLYSVLYERVSQT